MKCPQCSLNGGDQAGGVYTGLDASEMMIRGGCLPEPTLFTNLIVGSDGRRFLRLRKADDGLCRFLTGKGSYQCPLANTDAFETIRVRRNEAMDSLLEEMFGEMLEEEPEADPMAALGIDDPASSHCKQKGSSVNQEGAQGCRLEGDAFLCHCRPRARAGGRSSR